MGIETEISWCHHTHNGVRGCSKANLPDGSVDPACAHCYAEAMSKRNPRLLGEWGDDGKRVLAGDDYWKLLDKWHAAAVEAGEMRRVFCYSLGDVFEAPKNLGNADVCAKGRARLFDAVERLRPRQVRVPEQGVVYDWAGLAFMLLTKRPQNIRRMVPDGWLSKEGYSAGHSVAGWLRANDMEWPWWAWVGTSVGTQAAADERIPHLLDVPAKVRFLSCEPLVEAVDLSRWLRPDGGISLVITGGESGHKARPCHPDWVRKLRDQAKAAGAAFHHKQWGEWAPADIVRTNSMVFVHPNGESSADPWTLDPDSDGVIGMHRVGKKAAGRMLDGRTWDEMPEVGP